jgi:hypothetical protein
MVFLLDGHRFPIEDYCQDFLRLSESGSTRLRMEFWRGTGREHTGIAGVFGENRLREERVGPGG